MRMLSLFSGQGEGGAIPHQDGYRTAEQNHPAGCQPTGNGGYLGIQKFSLLRCLSEFEEKGAIRIEGKTITILNSDEMK